MIHRWIVYLQRQDGEVVQREVTANWDPDHALTDESVMSAARVEAYMESGPIHPARQQFAATQMEYVGRIEPGPVAA